MKFIDLSTQYSINKKNINNNINKVLNRGDFILGKEVGLLEKKLSKFTKSKYCITVANGTDALLLALISIGIKKDDEIITTPFSWISSSEVIKFLGAKPVYVDIKYDFLINEDLIERKITKKTKAILPVSLFGQIPAIDKINKIAKKYKLKVIEDAAQSFGATQNNLKSCSLTHIGCTSFFPSKPLGCYGDGGACFTNSATLAKKIISLRNHGKNKFKSFSKIGVNSRLDTLQAAILLAKLNILNKEIKERNNVAKNYKKLFQDMKVKIGIPKINKNNTSVYAQYTIITEQRYEIEKKFKSQNIPYGIYYNKLIPENRAYKDKINDLVIANILKKKVISLPFSPYLKYSDQKKIVYTIKKAIE